MAIRIYLPEVQLNEANASETKPNVWIYISISNRFVSSKNYKKRDGFDFDLINFPTLDSDVPHSTSYGVNISQLIRCARVSSHITNFSTRYKILISEVQ